MLPWVPTLKRRDSHAATTLFLAKLLDPSGHEIVAGGIDVDELDAHADARLDDAHHREAFHLLALARQYDPRARFQRQRLAGANEAAAHGNVGSYAGGVRAGFEINELGIRGKRIANRIATVAHATLA